MMHWPQLMQLDRFIPSPKAVSMRALLPRPVKSMADTAWTSSQTRTHFPQRTHLSGSRTIDGLEMSRFRFRLVPGIRRVRTPSSSDRSCNSQAPWRAQYRQSSGWLLSSSSTMVLRALTARAECVRTFIPSWTG